MQVLKTNTYTKDRKWGDQGGDHGGAVLILVTQGFGVQHFCKMTSQAWNLRRSFIDLSRECSV